MNEIFTKRKSIRKFKNDKISRDITDDILNAALLSPSWKNSQIMRYVVISNREVIDDIAQNGVNGFEFNTKTLLNAPCLIVACAVGMRCGYERDGSFSTNKKDAWEMFDAGIACQSIALEAAHVGVGSVILGIFDDEYIKEKLKLEDNLKVQALIACGYPDEAPNRPKRKELTDVVNYID